KQLVSVVRRIGRNRACNSTPLRTHDSYSGDYDQAPLKESPAGNSSASNNNNRKGSSKLLKRWHCRPRSTFRWDPSDIDTYTRRILPLVDKPVIPSRPGYGNSAATAAARTGKQFRALLQEVTSKSADVAADEFPILKAITENMCPGYGPLIPYQPQSLEGAGTNLTLAVRNFPAFWTGSLQLGNFSYILVGQDSYQFLEPRGIKKRSLYSEEESIDEASRISVVNEILETGETAYIPGASFKWNEQNSTNSDTYNDGKNNTRDDKDLLPSDFDYLKSAIFADPKTSSAENDTPIISDESTEEEVFVGEHNEDNRPLESLGLEENIGPSSPAPEDKVTDSILSDPMLVTPTEESLENSTMLWPMSDHSKTEESDNCQQFYIHHNQSREFSWGTFVSCGTY
ncbi:unnamed protein product, partial [Allacma fusca]